MRVVSALAIVTFGVALYLSRGVLDELPLGDGMARAALLPPWHVLAGFLAAASLGLLWLDRQVARRGSPRETAQPLGSLVLPVFGLVVLILPFLPVAADRLPMVQMFAGPLRGVIWLCVAAQVAWVLWQRRVFRFEWLEGGSPSRLALGVGLAAACAAGLVAVRLTGTPLYPSGDEPHYLVVAQSLWRDGDFKIENNHARRDYREYFAADLEPDYLTRGADGEIYSIHPVGLPVVMAPVYAAGGYPGVVFVLVVMAGVAAGLMWRAVVGLTEAPGAATFGVAAVVLTGPFLFNAFAVYPEVAAGLAVALAFTRLSSASPGPVLTRWGVVGVAGAALPWLSTKYAPMSAAIILIALARIVWPAAGSTPSRTGIVRASAALLLPYAASLVAWFSFFYAFWGTPWPQAPYGQLAQTRPLNLVFGAPGLLFDQEYGLVPYAPVYLLAATGLWRMWRAGGELARRSVEVVLLFGALLGTVGAFRIWWGGTAAPGRPLTSGLLLLALPIAVAFHSAPVPSARRAAHHLLLWFSIGIAGVLALAQSGLLISNGRDGTSSLLEYLSPRWPAWTAAPSFIYHEAPTALAHTAVWLLVASLAAIILRRVRTTQPGAAALTALGVGGVTLLLAAVFVPLVPADPAWPAIDRRARSRAPLIDEFDAVARPIGVTYTPFRVVAADGVTRLASLEVTPGTRTEPQPLRVVHNGRLSLPAGVYRLVVDWIGTGETQTLGLQLGRAGDPWRTWEVAPRAGDSWTSEFVLPVDVGFVGLRSAPDLERAIGRVLIVPVSIVDAARRPRLPPIVGASQGHGVDYFYTDEKAFAEAPGFWVRGRRQTRVIISRAQATGPLTLRVNSGPIPNRLHVAAANWGTSLELTPNLEASIEIPITDRPLVMLDFTAEHEFVPRELDATSKDPRPLGIWIEVVPR